MMSGQAGHGGASRSGLVEFVRSRRAERALIAAAFLAISGCSDPVGGPSGSSELAFVSSPPTAVFHNEPYRYEARVQGGGPTRSYAAPLLPGWLVFDSVAPSISGLATADNLGTHAVRLSATDGAVTVEQAFSITVALREVHSGSWVGRFPYDWPHDGRPLVGSVCDVYSDAADDVVKAAYLERAEAAVAGLVSIMDLDPSTEFEFPAGRSKIDVYVNRRHTEYGGGFAYHGGAIVLAPDHPNYRPNEGWCRNQVEHELMHVIETLLEGSDHLGADVWFREGIADYFANNAEITDRQALEEWLASRRSLPGGGNPIAIHLWDDFPDAVTAANAQGSWYAMFELAVRYVMSGSGLGRTYADVKRLFVSLAGGATPFPEAFDTHMGIALSTFEAEFFQRIEPFLDEGPGRVGQRQRDE